MSSKSEKRIGEPFDKSHEQTEKDGRMRHDLGGYSKRMALNKSFYSARNEYAFELAIYAAVVRWTREKFSCHPTPICHQTFRHGLCLCVCKLALAVHQFFFTDRHDSAYLELLGSFGYLHALLEAVEPIGTQ